MAIVLNGPDGLLASFSDTGDLVSFVSRNRTWELCGPTAGCGIALVLPDLRRQVFVPEPGTGEVLSEDDGSLEVLFPGGRSADGAVIAAPLRMEWWVSGGLLQGRAQLEALPQGHVLDALIFPDISVGISAEGRLIWPRLEGLIVKDAGQKLHGGGPDAFYSLRYPGHMSMQCLGWGEDGYGLYLDSRDTQGWSKVWHIRGQGDGATNFQLWHLAPREERPGGGFGVPYAASLGSFDGTWFDLGKTYRQWAIGRPTSCRGPAERRGTYIEDLACWVWNRGRIADVCPPVKELARRIGQPVALDWYWWHKHGYDMEYPDYFPPREGKGPFMEAVRDLQANGVYTQVYTNGVGVDMDGGTWLPDGPECVIEKETGEIQAVAFNKYTQHRLAFGCGASALWRKKVAAFVRQAHDLGLDGLYIDMVSNVAGAHPCYNPRHGHAPGGGFYEIEGFRTLWKELRETYPGFVFSTEAPSECLMDLVDGFITINTSNERLGNVHEPIQLWNAVYHGRAVCFGNYALLDGVPPFDELWPQEYRRTAEQERDWRALCPYQFSIELARTITGGIQPMVCNLRLEHFEDPSCGPDIDFLVDLCRFYHAHREWLLWGEMLAPGVLSCDSVDVQFLQRMIFTAAGKEKLLTKSEPSVLHSVWRSESSDVKAVFCNYTSDARRISYVPANGWIVGASLPEGFVRTQSGAEGVIPPRGCLSMPLEEG